MKETKLLLEWFIHSDEDISRQANTLWEKAHLDESSLDISVDYTDLFICDEIALKAPPYASFYLDASGELYSKENAKVQKIYESCSFFTKELLKQPADYAAIEFEFLASLLNTENSEITDKITKDFLSNHFLPWILPWSKDLQENAKTYFYKGLGFHIEVYCNFLIDIFKISEHSNTKVYRRAS
jgi:TorA maturation chaperone TorD